MSSAQCSMSLKVGPQCSAVVRVWNCVVTAAMNSHTTWKYVCWSDSMSKRADSQWSAAANCEENVKRIAIASEHLKHMRWPCKKKQIVGSTCANLRASVRRSVSVNSAICTLYVHLYLIPALIIKTISFHWDDWNFLQVIGFSTLVPSCDSELDRFSKWHLALANEPCLEPHGTKRSTQIAYLIG